MTFREVVSALRSRWWAAFLAMLVALAGGWLVVHPKPVYQTTAVVVLVPPKISAQNTLASVTPSIASAGLAVDDILLSAAEGSKLRAAGVVDQYTVTPRNNGTDETPAYTVPSEQITIIGGNAATGLAEAETLVEAYTASLRSMQASVGIVPQGQITDGLLASPSSVELQASRSRGLIAAGLLGLGVAVTLAVRLRPGRPSRRGASGRPWPAEDSGGPAGPETQEQDELFV